MTATKMKIVGWLLLLACVLFSCSKGQSKDGFVPDTAIKKKPEDETDPRKRKIIFTQVDGPYNKAMAVADFGMPIEMNWANSAVVDKQLRVRIPANTLSQGNIVNIDVPDGTEYELSFKVKFGAGFDWSRGGKVGFGFHIGNGYTGCNKADNGLGGTARLMWYHSTGSKTNKEYRCAF